MSALWSIVEIGLWKLCCGNCVVECKIGKKGGRKEERIEEGRKEGKKEGRKEYAHSCVSFCKTEHATVSLLGMCDYLCDHVIMWGTLKYFWEIMLCNIVIMSLCKYGIL